MYYESSAHFLTHLFRGLIINIKKSKGILFFVYFINLKLLKEKQHAIFVFNTDNIKHKLKGNPNGSFK